MALALLVSGAPAEAREPTTAIEAERAFAADAKAIGQWAAFRKWAAADAIMFVPQPVDAQAWLKDRADPLTSIEWTPTGSYVSCDGHTAVNTGEWRRSDRVVGYFSTVWQRQADGSWRWLLDHADALLSPRPRVTRIIPVRASCAHPVHHLALLEIYPDAKEGMLTSRDGTLQIDWKALPEGARRIRVLLAQRARPVSFPRGTYLLPVVSDIVAPAP